MPVTPSLRGLQGVLQKQLQGPMEAASKRAGDAMAKNLAAGAEKAARDVRRARKAEEDAADSVLEAEKRLGQERDAASRAVAAIESAELKLSAAREKATQDVAKAEADLSAARDAGDVDAIAAAESNLGQVRDRSTATVIDRERSLSSARSTAEKVTDRVADRESALAKAKDASADAADNVVAATKRYERAQDGTNDSVEEATGLFGKLRQAAGNLGPEFDEAAAATSGFGDKLRAGLSEMGRGALLGVGAKIGTSVMSGVSEAVSGGWQSALDIDTGTRVLEGLYGSAAEAQSMLSAIGEVAAKSPIDHSSYLAASQALAYTGVEGERAVTIMENVGLAALASGKDGDQAFETMNSALGKMVNEGRVGMESLSQLSGAGVPILSGLAEHFGVSMEEVNKMASKGAIDFEDVLSVMENATGGYFENALIAGEQASGSLSNQLARVKDQISTSVGSALAPILADMDFTAIADGLGTLAATVIPVLADAFAGLVTGVTVAVEKFTEFGQWVQDNRAWIEPLVVAVAGAATAWGVWTGAIGAWTAVTKIATAVQTAFNKVVAANKLMLIVTAISGVVAGLTWFFTQTEAGQAIWDGFTEALATGWEWVKGAFSSAWDAIEPILSGIGDALSRVGEVVGEVFSWITDNWQLVVSAVFGPMGAVIALAVTHWDSLKAGASAAFSILGDVVSSVWSNVIQPVFGFFRSAAGLLADVVTGNWENIGNRLSELGGRISQIIQGPINVAMDLFRSIVSNVGGAWDAFRGKVGEVVGAVKDRVSDMVDTIATIPDRIRDFFSNAGRWLLDAGKNIVGGLIDGIRSMASNVGNAISDIMPDFGFGGFFSGGGFFAEGGLSAYAAGGIRDLERYANGGDRPNAHTPQIARGGPVRVWAEPETKGEAYIPLANDHRRPRAEAILDTVATKFGKRLVNDDGSPFSPAYRGNLVGGQAFALGGVRTEKETVDWVRGRTVAGVRPPMGRPLERSRYVWGGGSANDWGDCSGMVSLVAGFIKGMWGEGRALRRLFATGNQGSVLRQMGFSLGKRTGPGIFSTGWFNGGPYGGHTSAQIGSTRIEMGGSRGDGQINGQAAPATHPQYTDHAWIKLKDAAPKTFDSMVSGSSTDAIRLGASGPIGGSSPASASAGVQWGSAQSLYEQAARYLGVADRRSVSIPTAGTDERDPLTPSPAGVPQGDDAPRPGWGPAFFTREIARVAKEAGLGAAGATIGVATKLVESGNPSKMYANRRVPESLAFRHDALGSDHDSVGLFQQRDNGAWGTVAQRMTPADSAKLFFDAMTRKYGNRWRGMNPGAVAQGVQVSAYPDRYGQQMAAASRAVKSTGLFDQGGVLPHGGLALNLSRKPEAILNNDQWGDFSTLVQHLGALIPVLADIARTGEFRGADSAFGLEEDSPIIAAALAVNQGWSDALTQIDAAQNELTSWAFTLGGDWLSGVKIVSDAEAGLIATREQGLADVEAIEKAEEALAEARDGGDAEQIAAAEKALEDARANGENAILELAAAERTVAASRITAMGEIGTEIFETFSAGAAALAKFGTEMARLQGMVDSTRQEVSKLHMERFNAQIKQVTSTHALRMAELDLERTRVSGIVSVARAEANLAAAQKGHLTMGQSSINGLASAVDRFRSSGVSAIDEIALSWVVNQAELAEAEWALREARAEANLNEQAALQKQAEAAFAVSQATMQQAQSAYLLRAQTAHLAQQTQHLYGMSQQNASGLGRFAQGASGLLGGLGKIAGAIATGVAGFAVGGPLGAIPGIIQGLSAIPDILGGGAQMHANAPEALEGWRELDGQGKLMLGLGVLGSGASIGLGAYGSAMGMGPEALAAGLQVGQGVLDAALGSMTGIADAHMTAINERFKWQTEAQVASFELERQLAEAEQEATQARFSARSAALSAEVEVAKLRRELAAAEREGLDASVLAALRVAAETAEAGRDSLVADARARQAELDAAVAELRDAAAEARSAAAAPTQVTINMPPGDPSRESMIATLEEMAAQLGIQELRINELEGPSGTSAEDYVDSRR